MKKLINLKDILNNHDGYKTGAQVKSGYILVTTVWASKISKDKSQQKRCRFIFSDGENQIPGFLFLNDGKNTDGRNVGRLLQDKSCQYKITNFTVIRNSEECFRVLRKQPLQLQLSSSTLDVEKVSSSIGTSASKYTLASINLPFEFTELSKIDNCKTGELVDLIGYALDITKSQTSQENQVDYRVMKLSTSRSKVPNRAGFEKEVALYGDLVIPKYRKNSVYVLLNVKVSEWKLKKETRKSLKSTKNTIIFRIDSLEDLPAHLHQLDFITNLLPKKRGSRSSTESNSTDNENISPEISLNSEDPPYSPTNPGYFTTPTIPNQYGNTDGLSSLFMTRHRSSAESQMPNNIPAKKGRLSPPSLEPPQFPHKDYNFVDCFKTLKVRQNTKLSTNFMDIGPDSYPMRSDRRGIALIINNYYFPERDTEDRERIRAGSQLDVEYLHDILLIFKFDVIIKDNVSVEELSNVLAEFKGKARPKMNACFVAILSHGAHGLVEMQNGKFARLPNDIIHQFDETAFPVFAGKPKIFVVQTCQDIPSQGTLSLLQHVMPDRENELELENMIECYAAAPGTSAGRDAYKGSHFIYVLVDTLMDHAHDTDFETILKEVQNRLKKVRRTNENKLHCKWGCLQFNKKLYFNPGL